MNDSEQVNEEAQTRDQDARERIIHAALCQFAEHGFRGASIRGIARAANVSPGLVQHHFGTKEGLRDACDAWVMEFLAETQREIVARGEAPSPEIMIGRLDALQPMIDYLIGQLSSGSEAASHWFRQITEYTHESLTSGRLGVKLDPDEIDTRAIAATQAAMALGITAFFRHIQSVIDEPDEHQLTLRVGRARLFLASERVVSEETRRRLAGALDEYEQSKTTGKPPPADEAAH